MVGIGGMVGVFRSGGEADTTVGFSVVGFVKGRGVFGFYFWRRRSEGWSGL